MAHYALWANRNGQHRWEGPYADAERAEAALRQVIDKSGGTVITQSQAPDLPQLYWAPYQEFGIPDPAAETEEPPSVPFTVGSTGYRGADIIVYWIAGVAAPSPGTPGDNAPAGEVMRRR
jgi:hypothetical protein